MKPLIEIDSSLCTLCYACVRTCPVKALKIFKNGQIPVFDPDLCIGCGNCVHTCSYEAINYRSSISEIEAYFKQGLNVVAICDPAISAEFNDITDYRKFVSMIKMLGFSSVYEISFGADLVAKAYQRNFQNFKGKYYISSCCPVVVSYIEKYSPALVMNLVPVVQPREATAKSIRSLNENNCKIVEITPCLATKNETSHFSSESSIDQVITFEELRTWFSIKGINESMTEYSEFDGPLGYTGALFPITNGILQTAQINESIIDSDWITVEGKNHSMNSIKEFENNIERINSNFNIFYCEGCIMGPGTSRNGKKLFRRSLVKSYVKKRSSNLDLENWKKNIIQFEAIDLSRTFKNNDQRAAEPTEVEISAILQSLGKESHIDNQSGCGTCGFTSCREHAKAVIQGYSVPEMCNTYSMQSQNRYIKSLRQTNEKMAQIQAALKESERQAKKERELAKEASETTQSMLRKIPTGLIIINQNFKITFANQSLINILGDEVKEINEVIPGLSGADLKSLFPFEFYNLVAYVMETHSEVQNKDIHVDDQLLNVTVFPIKPGKIVGAVIRDMHTPEVRSEEAVSRLGEVIDLNLEMVQKIGFLLGEGASETEKMLNSIIESFKKSSKKTNG